MRKNVFGRRFKRDMNERKSLFKGLLSSLVLKKRIQTTEEKAKSIKGVLDKIVTKTKKNGKNSSRFLGKYLNAEALKELINEMLPHLGKRQSGYTRIIRLGRRFNDNAQMVVMEWVDEFPKAAALIPVTKKAKGELKKESVKKVEEKKKETVKRKPKATKAKK